MSEEIIGQWPNLNHYKVLVLVDRFDGDSDRIVVNLRAFGKLDARAQVKQDYPDGSVLSVEQVAS